MFNWEIFWGIISTFVGIGVGISLAILAAFLFDGEHLVAGWAIIVIMLIGMAAVGGFIG